MHRLIIWLLLYYQLINHGYLAFSCVGISSVASLIEKSTWQNPHIAVTDFPITMWCQLGWERICIKLLESVGYENAKEENAFSIWFFLPFIHIIHIHQPFSLLLKGWTTPTLFGQKGMFNFGKDWTRSGSSWTISNGSKEHSGKGLDDKNSLLEEQKLYWFN